MKKLVRNRIPEILQREGLDFSTRNLAGDELGRALIAKLKEEVAEMEEIFDIPTGLVQEIADVYEVLVAIIRHKGLSEHSILRVMQDKCEERGDFSEGIFVEMR